VSSSSSLLLRLSVLLTTSLPCVTGCTVYKINAFSQL